VNNLARVIGREMDLSGVSQTELAIMTHCCKATVSNYLNGKRSIPADWARAVANYLNSAKLKIIHSWECGCGFFKTKYMAGVDDHPVTVKSKGIQELAEAIEALATLDIENKRSREDFTREEWIRYEAAIEQICDLHPYIEKVLESGQKHFNLDVEAMQHRINRKLINKGYTREKTTRDRAVS
jgi:transcriptional regulator with XRE-family HTH domain